MFLFSCSRFLVVHVLKKCFCCFYSHFASSSSSSSSSSCSCGGGGGSGGGDCWHSMPAFLFL